MRCAGYILLLHQSAHTNTSDKMMIKQLLADYPEFAPGIHQINFANLRTRCTMSLLLQHWFDNRGRHEVSSKVVDRFRLSRKRKKGSMLVHGAD